MAKPKAPTPPPHLTAHTAKWWRAVHVDYMLDEHHTRLLTLACEAWDQNALAREAIAKQGITFTDDRGNIRANPAVAIAKDAKVLFARMVRELDLDVEAPADSRVGPPSLRSNRG